MMGKSSIVDTAYQHCREITFREAKNFYFAFITLPSPKRRAIYVAYAFARMCDDIADGSDSDSVKRDQLQQVRESLNAAYRGLPDGLLFIALADVAMRYNVPEQYFHNLVSGIEIDIWKSRYSTFTELEEYCYGVAATTGLICGEIFGYSDVIAKEYAVDLGLAMQLTNILRDIKEDGERNRIYLPQEEIRIYGYSEDELLRGIINEQYLSLMRFQYQRARSHYEKARNILPLVPLRSRACVAILHGLYSKLLDRIRDCDFDVFSRRIRLSNREKLLLTTQLWLTNFLPIPKS